MKIAKKSVVCVVLSLCLMMFGGWTTRSAAETEERYADAPMLSLQATEYIYYTNKVIVAEKNTVNNTPTYDPYTNLTNACGAVAGTIVVGFYDKYYPNLIPDWQSYFPNGKYRGMDRVYVPAAMTELYNLMRTNVDDVGVSEEDCLNGLRTYINNHGYSINYNSVATSTTLNYTACKNAIDSNNLVMIFSNPCDIYQIGLLDGSDLVSSTNIAGNHIMVVYGYLEINYYDSNGLFRTDTYLKVATGQVGIATALYKISPHKLNAAYAITIQ